MPVVLSAYPPSGEISSDLAVERALFAGGMVVMLGYGFYVSLTGATLCLLFNAPRRPSCLVLSYIFLLSVGATLFTGLNWLWAQKLFIEDRGYPGGPSRYFFDVFYDWVNTFSNTVLFTNSLLVDSLMLWRTYLIYDSRKRIIVLPALWLTGTTALSILTLTHTSKPGQNPWQAVQFAIPYFASSVALNLALTLLIAGRLIYIRQHLPAGLARASPYLSLAAMLIESSTLYSIVGIATIVTFAVGSYGAVFMVPLLGEVTCIAPMLILLRVGFGSAFTRSTSRWPSSRAYVSSIDFHHTTTTLPGGAGGIDGPVARPPPIFFRALSDQQDSPVSLKVPSSDECK